MSFKPSKVDIETIRNAAELVNSSLISKAYIDRDIKYLTTDWRALLKEQVDDLEITNKIYDNDKNNLNILYSLLQALDRSKAQHKASNRVIASKDATIAELNQKVSSLESQLRQTEDRFSKSIQFDQNDLERQVQQLTQHNKSQSQDLLKLKNWCADIKTKFQVEMKKKNIEIDTLKNKLLFKRGLPSSLSFGNIPSPEGTNNDQNIIPYIIYNNNPIIDNNSNHNKEQISIKTALNTEYEEILSDLTGVIESLVSENHKITTFLRLINDYYSNINSQLSNYKHRDLSTLSLPNPSDTIDLNLIENDVAQKNNELFDELESFEFIAKPVLNNVYRNYHCILSLLNEIGTSSKDQGSADNKKIEQLTDELEVTKKNWMDAIKTLEKWREYSRSNEN